MKQMKIRMIKAKYYSLNFDIYGQTPFQWRLYYDAFSYYYFISVSASLCLALGLPSKERHVPRPPRAVNYGTREGGGGVGRP